MSKLSVHEARVHFSEVIRKVEAGEVVIVTRHNRPVAELRPIQAEPKKRKFGSFTGEFTVPEDAFSPLTPEELADWDGG